jgi:FKBP-type peptidyl-prolyl cis-trans isomerase FkpA
MKIVSCGLFFKLNYYKMKLSLRLLLLLPFIFVIVGCPSDDASSTEEVIRNPLEVYNEDIAEIEEFMNTHSITVDGDYNTTFTKITGSTPGVPISAHPNLTFKTVTTLGVAHKLYFIKLREGSGNSDTDPNNDQPTKLDSIYTSYKGIKTNLETFDNASNPVWFDFDDVYVQAWHNVFPEFKRGNFTFSNATGITTFSDFGAGVMFVPSGLAYFNKSQGVISSYTPLIFSFKLMNVRYNDSDGDKILSKDEYSGTGIVTGSAIDSDGDGKPNYADFDDDNDGVLTKNEIKYTYVDGLVTKSTWYPFNGIAIDDPMTAIDETKGIPSCSGDFITPTRVRKHLSSNCQ